jgi:hypothetical protein
MAFGQYARIGKRLEREREVGYREPAKDAGFPIPREQVRGGRMTNAQVLSGAEPEGWVDAIRTAHNEVTRDYITHRVVRLRETDIAVIYLNGDIALDTGGWNTVTTRAHMMGVLSREGHPAVGIYGAKCNKGRNVLNAQPFERRIMFKPDGNHISDV